MATYSDATSVSSTLTSTTADTITLTQLWPYIAVTNHSTSPALYIRMDGTTAVSEADGTATILPNTTRILKTYPKVATGTVEISIVGDGNSYTIEGVQGNTATEAYVDEVIAGLEPNGTFRVVGSGTTPETNAAAARPAGDAPVYWMMANAVTPSNAIAGDIIWNADA